jgi:hypothetical protein
LFAPSGILSGKMMRMRMPVRPKFRRQFSTAWPDATRRALETCILAVQDCSDPEAQGAAAAELHGLISRDLSGTVPPPPPAARDIVAWDSTPAGVLLDSLYTAGGTGSDKDATSTSPSTATATTPPTTASEASTGRALVFGRVPPSSLNVVFDRIVARGGLIDLDRSPTPNTFVDIGSGDGLVCLGASLILPFDVSEGFEVVPSLHASAESLSHRVSARNEEVDEVDSCGVVSFRLADARKAMWSRDARVVFTNWAAFDGSLMQSLTERAASMTPGAFFITVGQPMSSPHFELVDRVLLPANGKGKHGGALEEQEEADEDHHHDAVNDEADADVGEDIRLRKAGVYDFFVYQRLVDTDAEPTSACIDTLQRAVSDTEAQRVLRGHGHGGMAALCAILSTETCTDEVRTSCALALHSSMVCEPSMRAATDVGIVDLSLSLVEESKGVLGVCGILLLSAVASHSYGARSVVLGGTTSTASHKARLRSALEGVLAPVYNALTFLEMAAEEDNR